MRFHRNFQFRRFNKSKRALNEILHVPLSSSTSIERDIIGDCNLIFFKQTTWTCVFLCVCACASYLFICRLVAILQSILSLISLWFLPCVACESQTRPLCIRSRKKTKQQECNKPALKVRHNVRAQVVFLCVSSIFRMHAKHSAEKKHKTKYAKRTTRTFQVFIRLQFSLSCVDSCVYAHIICRCVFIINFCFLSFKVYAFECQSIIFLSHLYSHSRSHSQMQCHLSSFIRFK